MFGWHSCSKAWAVGLVWLAVSFPGNLATAKPPPASSEAVPTTITSQKLTVRNQEHKAIFEGAVVLTKGTLVVHSDVMVVLFKSTEQGSSAKQDGEDTNGSGKSTGGMEKAARTEPGDGPSISNQSVSTVEATGRVRIEKDEGRATCTKAIYYADEEKIVMTGNPVAWQKGTRVTGKRITMYLIEERSVVEGGSKVRIEPDGGEGK